MNTNSYPYFTYYANFALKYNVILGPFQQFFPINKNNIMTISKSTLHSSANDNCIICGKKANCNYYTIVIEDGNNLYNRPLCYQCAININSIQIGEYDKFDHEIVVDIDVEKINIESILVCVWNANPKVKIALIVDSLLLYDVNCYIQLETLKYFFAYNALQKLADERKVNCVIKIDLYDNYNHKYVAYYVDKLLEWVFVLKQILCADVINKIMINTTTADIEDIIKFNNRINK